MKYALLKTLIFFWQVLMLFPVNFHKAFRRIFIYFLVRLFFKRNRYSKVNIIKCFPELDLKERNKIYKNNLFELSNIFFTTGVAWFWSNKRIQKNILYEINGINKLLNTQKSKDGVLLLFKHSLHLELDMRILGMNAEIYGIEREHNSKNFNLVQRNGRLKSLKDLVDRKNTFTFMRWLKNGKTVLYAPDQDYGSKKSIEIDFFNLPAATIKAPYKIMKKTNCKIFFLNSFYKENKLILNIEELAISHLSEFEFLRELNNFIESKIRLNPSEYLWQHRRFKSTLGKNGIYNK